MKPCIKVKPHYDETITPSASQGIFCQDWKLPCDNQIMSNLVFSVSLYILVVLRFTIFFRMAGLQCLMNLVSIELLSPSELLEVDPIMS